MDIIDVRDLSEEEAQLVAEFVEFVRQRKKRVPQSARPAIAPESGRPAVEERPFAAWPLGVQGTLTREEIYDHL
jgi:hypothetical protein